MIHGVGAETPTQVLIFLAAAGAGRPGGRGLRCSLAFIVGLLVANSVITVRLGARVPARLEELRRLRHGCRRHRARSA